MKNEKLTDLKNRIKKNAPQIALGTLAIISTTYAVLLKTSQPQQGRRKLSDGGDVYLLAMNKEGKEELEGGDNMIWKFKDGVVIDLWYDPDC